MTSKQHNRLHNGRPMRVQLRDRNPARGMAWKYGRGRGKYPHSNLPRHYLDSAGIVSQETSLEKDGKVEPTDQILEADSLDQTNTTPAVTYPTLLEHSTDATCAVGILAGSLHRFGGMVSSSPDGQIDGLVRAQTPEPISTEHPCSGKASPQSSFTREAPLRYEGQAWNHGTDSSAPLTPAPSSYASSVSAATPSIPYGLPNMGFYQAQPWVQPFAQYPMPYIAGYPGYPLPSHQAPQSFTSSSGSESSGPSTGAQVPWASNVGVYPVCAHFYLYLELG
jgi:hypothetical protein